MCIRDRGEYCAAAATGGMSAEDAIVTVRKRGILMQNAVPDGKGAMAVSYTHLGQHMQYWK